MDMNHDPFPSSLPCLDSPQIFDSEMTQDGGIEFFNSAFPQDSPSRLFGDSPYQSPIPVKTMNAKSTSKRRVSGDNYTASPESSLQDSSSDSSGRHKRNTSSNSSRSALAGINMAVVNGARPNGWKAQSTIMPDREPIFDYSSSTMPMDVNYEFSNRAMENDFDFESAASSPSPNFTSTSSNRHIAIPYRASPSVAPSLLPNARSPVGGRETSPLSTMVTPEIQPPALQHSRSSPTSSNEEYINGAMLNGMEQLSTWPWNNQAMNTGLSNQVAPLNIQNVPTNDPMGSNQPSAGSQFGRAIMHALKVHPTPMKSRVETQIPIKLTLFPMPQGISKLHLPTHTISKPKLLSKPTPSKAPDMLELYTMLVCTSAMQDPVKMRRAFARAAQPSVVKKEEVSRSSSEEVPTADDDENKPLNGGEVHICIGCITRERKRAARKKSKKPEEEEPWQQDEAKRIIVFNCSEVKEWQPPTNLNPGPNSADMGFPNNAGSRDGPPAYIPDGAMQVDIPMRIACYCRHQNEKLGFQVIFTIKDYQDNLIGQVMTSPIVITDDHKTHAPPTTIPPPGSIFADSAQLQSAGVFGREPLENYAPAPSRNAHSTTDLQNLQQNFNPYAARPTISPFAIPQTSSHTTSGTLTPRSMSRQTSPSASSGPVQKKRKASGCGKVPTNLTMTRLETSQGSTAPNQSWTAAASSHVPVSAGSSPYNSTYPNFGVSQDRIYGGPTTSTPVQLHTGPPTPINNDNTFFNSTNRSQSMDNLSAVQQMFSAPSSAHQSRASSPVTASRTNTNTLPHGHTPAVANSLYGLSNPVNTQRSPTIHKLIPGEGTKAGGIEVTCLGSGFCQGLEVMFGDCLATTTTYWGETSLVCLLPPSLHAGTVAVTFKHHYQQQLQLARFTPPSIPKQQVYFKYIDDDEQELLRHALALVHQKMTGRIEDAGEIARRIISAGPSGQGPWAAGSSQSGEQQRQASPLKAYLGESADLETAVLKCLDLIDLDDSPHQARLNLRRGNGQSILHISASLGYHRLVAGLLARGANPDLRDKNGMSPMHMASLNGHPQIVRRLRLAGGDPTLRSLLGYTPADMACSQDVFDAVRALHHHSRSKSAGANSTRFQSRGSSTTSLKSLWETPSIYESTDLQDSRLDPSDDEASSDDEESVTQARPVASPAQLWARSRRNSASVAQTLIGDNSSEHLTGTTGLLSPAAAMAAWRDQLAAQIQHFQQSVNWTLPNLQIPTLPPMPYLPDYQTYPVMRRISSLVPQRPLRPASSSATNRDVKEGDYRWWELLTGTASSPPAYEEIYPQEDLDKKTVSAARAAADALVDQKCAANFDHVEAESSTTITSTMGDKQQQEQLRSAHARKVKRLRSDRNLFFIWIPLLVLVVMAMLKDRVPQVWQLGCQAAVYIQKTYNERIVEVL